MISMEKTWKYSLSEVCAELQREINMRHVVYGRKIADGTMNADHAHRKIQQISQALEMLQSAYDKAQYSLFREGDL